MKNLWILTEERPKKQSLEVILDYFAKHMSIAYKGGEVIQANNNRVLMVNSINGKYYTQSEGAEDKNNYLGVHVIRESGS